ncbi:MULTISPECIES: hypothetical protein [Gordonia]|uniref:Integral membrane protein n=2 Tax=Gordonia TaxID=2053 RepID=A0A9X3D7N0_9ACTN|nr:MULTISPECIES: hypothetical protein [Gordonia]MCF3937100.1 hypothetical protein [Gordonia tangerina]MCX2966603.1 hypothetical protein [Gordonia aquimaris]
MSEPTGGHPEPDAGADRPEDAGAQHPAGTAAERLVDEKEGPVDGKEGPLDPDERAELQRLRAQVAELRATPAPQRRMFWRRFTAVVLVVLCALLTLLSVTTRYVRGELLDTDHYLTTVAPLASDPAVQGQVTDAITAAIDEQVDIRQITEDALQQLVDLTPAERPRIDQTVVGLAPVLANQAESFIEQTVSRFVQSDQFEQLWVTANRAAHQSVVAVLTGDTERGAVEVDPNGAISIELGPIIEQVKQILSDRGFAFANNIPQVDKSFVVFESPQLANAQRWVNALDKVADVLPWLALAAAIGAIAVIGAGRRLRMTAVVAVSIVVAMLLLAIGLLIGRAVYMSEIPADVLAPDAARVIFDTVVNPLRLALRAVAVAALVVALVVFFAGGSRSAQAIRRGFTGGIGALDARRKQRAPNAVEQALYQARIPVRIAVVVGAALILMFWSYPTGLVVIWTVVITCLALAALEIAMRPARREVAAEAATPGP